MALPYRRLHARFPCSLPVKVLARGMETRGTALNIGMGGIYVRVSDKLPPGPVRVEVSIDGDVFSLNGKLAHDTGGDSRASERSYGIVFAGGAATQTKVRLIVDRVRITGAPAGQLLSDYWRSP